MPNITLLFAGQPLPSGGLSNEKELVNACPQEFTQPQNPWHHFANRVFQCKGRRILINLPYRDYNDGKKQIPMMYEILSGSCSDSEKIAIAAWMFSEMLRNAPRGNECGPFEDL